MHSRRRLPITLLIIIYNNHISADPDMISKNMTRGTAHVKCGSSIRHTWLDVPVPWKVDQGYDADEDFWKFNTRPTPL